MNFRVDHIPKKKGKRPGTAMKPQYLTIHSTGNPSSTAKNERAWLTNPSNTRTASWHIVVDQNEAIEAIPLNEVAYHAGTAAGNSKSIGLEICESGNREKTLAHAAEVAASILKKYGWGVDRLRRHHDWSGKICPRILQPNNWAGWGQFKRDVQKELSGGETVSTKNQPSSWAKNAWEWAKKEGVTDGTDPKGMVTREQLVTMLYRYHKQVAKK